MHKGWQLSDRPSPRPAGLRRPSARAAFRRQALREAMKKTVTFVTGNEKKREEVLCPFPILARIIREPSCSKAPIQT